jgi:alanyl aminopeptidase
VLGDLRPLVADELRPNWERWLRRLFGAQAKALGFAARRRTATTRCACARAARIPRRRRQRRGAAGAGDAAALRWLGDRKRLDGTMVETVLQAAARRGDRELFERLRRRSRRDRRERRSLYAALGSFGDPALARSALALLLDPRTTTARPRRSPGRCPARRRAARLVFAFVKQNFEALVARAPRDAAASFPRWADGYCSAAGRAEVEDFFASARRATRAVRASSRRRSNASPCAPPSRSGSRPTFPPS